MPASKKPPSRGVWLRRSGEKAELEREMLGAMLDGQQMAALGSWYWQGWARDNQLPPEKAWRTWLICAGRGFGKTRAGAEWVRDVARHDGRARIALVGASLQEVRTVMVEGDSGVLAASPGALAPHYESSLRKLTWENGAEAYLYSAGEPDSLRGPQHSHAWCDEVAKWDRANDRDIAAWDNLQLTMRVGDKPRILATTTPRKTDLMDRLEQEAKRGEVVLAKGKTADAREVLPADFFAAMYRQYEETTFGRQELDGEMVDGADGALWSRAMIERCRVAGPVALATRTVVAVDPPATSTGACGIVVAELGADGVATVRADCSIERASPEKWARAVARAAEAWAVDRVVAEVNQGGEMVVSTLKAVDIRLPVKKVNASKAFAPGQVVALAGEGLWRIVEWEWRSGGIELDLVRPELTGIAPTGTDAGNPWRPSDRLPANTILYAFELPWDGAGAADTARLHVAVGASEGRWAGAALCRAGRGAGPDRPCRCAAGNNRDADRRARAFARADVRARCDRRPALR